MSGKLRELKNRIKSVENTKKITRAMEMVAAAKLRRFQNLMLQARPYSEGLESLLKRLHKNLPSKSHPFFEQREEKKIAVVLMTSDSGLCGSYNYNLIEHVTKFLKDRVQVKTLIGVGKSGITALKRSGHHFLETFTEIRPNRFDEILLGLRTLLEKLFLSGEVDAVYVVYNQFLSLSTFKATAEKLLPLEKPAADEPAGRSELEYIFEPSADIIFERLIPAYFTSKVSQMFLEAVVTEQIARMTAMHMATENAKEMIEALVLQRNKARQASITKEIIEIVSGSQASKRK